MVYSISSSYSRGDFLLPSLGNQGNRFFIANIDNKQVARKPLAIAAIKALLSPFVASFTFESLSPILVIPRAL